MVSIKPCHSRPHCESIVQKTLITSHLSSSPLHLNWHVNLHVHVPPHFSEEGIVLRPEQLKGQLEFQNVSFAYPTRKDAPIFQDLSLSVPSGSVMAVVGPSGSGKSYCKSMKLLAFRNLI